MPTYVYACCMYMYMYIHVDLVYQSFVLRSVQMWKVLGFVTNTCTAHASPSVLGFYITSYYRALISKVPTCLCSCKCSYKPLHCRLLPYMCV